MNWLRNHPYFDALVAAGIVLAVGFLVVRARLSITPADETEGVWDGGGIIVGDTSHVPTTPTPTPATPSLTQGTDHGSIPLNSGNTTATPAPDDAPFNFDAFMAAISKPASSQSTSNTSGQTDNSAYAFIPQGLIATTTSLATVRTPVQDALYAYGNEIGGTIDSFENSHPNQPAILKDFIEDKTDQGKIAAMKQLGADMAQVGISFEGMDNVPPSAQSAHKGLAVSYKEIGTKLAAIPDAQGNDALYNAIITYDASAELFVKNYLKVVSVFQAYGVTFSSEDGGSVFVFPSSGF